MARNTALCYVRLSWTRNPNLEDSPERQRDNIQAYCDFRGWQAEFYEDIDGHRTGTKETNRPGWMALKERISDPDVVALVANDLSRFHRKGFRMGQLIEMCRESGVELVKAADKKSIDVNDLTATMWVMMEALFNEFYAEDISHRMKDSARHRKAKGIIVGGIPFGTVRPRKDGRSSFLERSPLGVWLLPDGDIVEGTCDQPPAQGAVFRGYIDAVERIFALYEENRYGKIKIAAKINAEGYRFTGGVAFTPQHIRHIVASWVEYGGAVIEIKPKKRSAKDVTPESVVLNPERAVIDVELCYRVGEVRAQRYRKPVQSKPGGTHLTDHIFPLSKIAFCAQCEREGHRTYLTGQLAKHGPRYRHSGDGFRCSAHNRSVKAGMMEAEFARMISLLSVKPSAAPTFAALFSEITDRSMTQERRDEILAEIALCKQRIQNAEKLFLMARLSEEELRRHIDDNERQLARLQAELSDEAQIRRVLEMAVSMLNEMGEGWQSARNEDRQAFAQNLFSEIVFDLDTHRIVDFKLKPWAEPFLQVRVAGEGTPDSQDPSGHPAAHFSAPEACVQQVLSWL